jgi:uncharacterized protein
MALQNTKGLIWAFISGLIFAIGLALSGMTQPDKVMNFLDFAGQWDPSLAFVMGGGVLLNAALYWLTRRKLERPLLAPSFALPLRTRIDWPLMAGAALFGVGWGLGGYCPGPAIAAAPLGGASALMFLGAMMLGMKLHDVARAAAR